MKKNSAFTLVELLVVITIIAILAGLAIPAVLGSLEKARAVTDLNQLKSMGQGTARYLSDNEDDMFPESAGQGWPVLLHNYVPDWKGFQSPFDKRPNRGTSPYPISYAVNTNVFGKNTSSYTSASELIIMAPQKQAEKGPPSALFTGTSTSNPKLAMGGSYATHGSGRAGQINCLYGDFHASQLTLAEFKDTLSIKGRARWQPTNN